MTSQKGGGPIGEGARTPRPTGASATTRIAVAPSAGTPTTEAAKCRLGVTQTARTGGSPPPGAAIWRSVSAFLVTDVAESGEARASEGLLDTGRETFARRPLSAQLCLLRERASHSLSQMGAALFVR